MPRPRRRHRQVYSEARQFDLFHLPYAASAPPGPEWGVLPEAIRRRVTSLMARLLLEHGRDDQRPTSAGECGDV
jgi:hypothetical protein